MSRFSFHIFGTREAYFMVAASMFLGLFVGLSLQSLISGMENTALLDRLIMLLGEIAILVPPLFILNQRKLSLTQVLPLKKVSPITIGMSILLIGGVIGLVSVFEVLILPYYPVPEFLEQMDATLFDGGLLANVILISAAVLVAPFVEEFLFRGLLQQSLFYHFGSILPAMVIPTVVFSLFHVGYLFYFPAMVELLTLGLLLAWLMVKTGNLLIPMLTHALFNLSAFSGLFLGLDEETSSLADLGWTWIVISTALFGIGWFYFKRMKTVECDDVYLIPLPHEVDR
ncbi:MAG: CPBP family intramembrane metalloprotease [Candidatus Marinimicrobia bacterium]|nr:CPBP family intramembrane metalloprotease [Candidatus Neomarinimicrobiota bacterium]